MKRQILVPLDGTPRTENILPQVEALARATESDVALLFIEPMLDPIYNISLLSAIPAAYDEHPTWPRPYLEGVAARLRQRGLGVSADVVAAVDIASTILERARDPQVRLIAMASHRRNSMERWILGSIAERVLHAAPKPLLVVRVTGDQQAREPVVAYRKILVALDGSRFAAQALDQACALAKATDAMVVLLAVAPASDDIGLAQGGLEPFWMMAERASHEACLQQSLMEVASALRADGMRVRTILEQGAPAQAIIDACATEHADLLIMATHGRSGLRRLVMGSVATGVLHQTDVPLLLIRAQDTGVRYSPAPDTVGAIRPR